jgi:hypothetical protein
MIRVGLELESGDIGHDCYTLNVAIIVKLFARYETVVLQQAEVCNIFFHDRIILPFLAVIQPPLT